MCLLNGVASGPRRVAAFSHFWFLGGIPNPEMLPLQHLTAKEWWLYFEPLQRSERLPQAEQKYT